ncbi:extracellular solute-binding protein [Ruminiclostridium papyrosolvens]|uniref:ABC transporter substrate-binding protein n=1 Tax=Ruminiclostridium papyrosolvens C7 TaxID=1330534 RepID=U4R107_9FIRM|nr:extracellular solute-binding protein [Ruminiclostridium papyrosolvens]EPR10448.1 ABC transporter substrate-binding protein [Ruminiclostridium papyrosolvens C7]
MKKIFVLFLAVLMIVSSLAACGQSSNSTSSNTSTAGTATGAKALDGEKPELKYLGYNVSFDPNTDGMAKIYEEKTGYKVKYNVLPAENADEKLLMEVASGADYDVIQVSVSQFQTLLSQGALKPLSDLLNQHGQDVLKGVNEDSWKACSGPDGKIYGIPYKYPYPTEVTTFMVARMDLMKAAGINELPKTIDEFYNTLVTLKKFYGDKYIIFTGPFRAASEASVNWDIPQSITSAFGIYNDWMVDENGKVYYMTEHKNFSKMIEFMQKLSNEGLIDRDWAVNNTTTVNEKLSAGKAIIAASNRVGVAVTTPIMTGKDGLGLKNEDLGYIGALAGSDGTCKYMKTEAINQVTCILKSSKNAEHVIKWINIKQQNQLYLNIGVEGTHFTYDTDGSIKPINPIFAEERGNSYWYLNSTNEEEFAKQWPSRVRKSDAMWAAFDAVTNKANKETPNIFVDNTFAFMPSLENYSKYNQSLFKATSDFTLQLIGGTKKIGDLKTFQSDWTNSGGEKIRTEMQNWYNEFYGKK